MREPRARAGRSWLALACALALIGCTGDPGPSAGQGGPATPSAASSSASNAPTASPTPPVSDGFGVLPAAPPPDFDGGISCSGSIDANDPVALVEVKGTDPDNDETVLRNYLDPDVPTTVCTLGTSGWAGARFVDGRHLVAPAGGDNEGLYVVVEVPEVRYHWFQLPVGAGGAGSTDLVAVSPALDRVLWIERHAGGAEIDKVHLATATGDKVVAQARDTNAGRCGDQDDSDFGAFTRSGTLAYVLNRPDPSDASLLVIDDDAVAFSLAVPKSGWPTGGGPAMAVWSPTTETLYYRNGADAWRWSADGGASRFLPGVRWFFPTISPDGTFLAYTALRSDGLPDVYLVDLANPSEPMLLGTQRHNEPAFLSNEQLWYVAMQYTPGCEGADTRTPFAYHIADGTDTPSDVVRVVATWPATSSSH